MRTSFFALFSILMLSCSQQPDWQPLFINVLSNAMDEKGTNSGVVVYCTDRES